MALTLKLLPAYLKSMGLLRGLVTFLKVEWLALRRFRFGNYANDIVLRPNTTDRKVFREIFLFNTYARPYPFAPRFIVDAGANIGLSTLFFHQQFPSATVIAIEPEQSNFEVLRENVSGIENIRCVNTGVWFEDSYLRIRDSKEAKWAFSVEKATESEAGAFRAISIPTIKREFSIDVIDILKVDIEGSELELFSKDYDGWLSRTRLLIIEVHDWMKPGCSAAVFRAVSKYNIETTMNQGMLYIQNKDL